MDRKEATLIAKETYAEHDAEIESGIEYNGTFFFFEKNGDSFDPTQAALVVDDFGKRYEACNPATEAFAKIMAGEKFI